MSFILAIVGVVLADIAIPYGAWGYGASSASVSESEFMRRYDLFSIPRLAVGVLCCLLIGACSLFPREQELLGWIAIACMVFFCALALYDTLKAGAWFQSKLKSQR